MMATRPPGLQHPHDLGQRRRRFGDQLQHGQGGDRVEGFVAERQPLRVGAEEADVGTRLRVDRTGQHRLGDVDAERQAVGPAARASEAVTLPGPLPTSRATPPVGMFSHSIGSCHALTSLARERLRVVVEHRAEPGRPRRLDGAGVLRSGVRRGSVDEQVEVARADVGVGRRIGQQVHCPAQRGRQLGRHLIGHSSTLRRRFRRPTGRRGRENPLP